MKSIDWWLNKLVYSSYKRRFEAVIAWLNKMIQSFLTALIGADFALEKGRFFK